MRLKVCASEATSPEPTASSPRTRACRSPSEIALAAAATLRIGSSTERRK